MFSILLAMLAGLGAVAGLGGGSSKDRPTSGTTQSNSEITPVAVVEETPDPVVEETPDPVVEGTPPAAPVQPGSQEEEAPEATVINADFSGTAIQGMVKTFDLGDESIAKVEILDMPAYGNVTVNPDNTLAVVLTGTTQTDNIDFSVRLTHTDGSVNDQTVALEVNEGELEAGWGLGNFYMLETDDNDRVVVEHGENHRKVHISGDEDALSLRDIEILEGMEEGSLNGAWLMKNPEYGADPDMALAQDSGMELWLAMTGGGTEPSSDWLLLERGYSYDDLGYFVDRGSMGESELNPLYIGAYGEGDKPEITSWLTMTKDGYENVVMQDLHLTGSANILKGTNLLFDDIKITGEEFGFQNIDGFTMRNSEIYDVFREENIGGNDEIWGPRSNRISGIYGDKSDRVLLEQLYFDHNGWEDGYAIDQSLDSPQPPSLYSHNIYLNYDLSDITLRDTITMRSASIGAMVRSGGVVEDNLLLDNQVGLVLQRGQEYVEGEGYNGNYSLASDNVVTSASHLIVTGTQQGGLSMGITTRTPEGSLVDNIVAHLANPDDPDEIAAKTVGQSPLAYNGIEPYYDDTVIYNWKGSDTPDSEENADQNVETLDKVVLDEVTIQNFTAGLLGTESATISDLANYLRGQADGTLDDVVDADLVIAYFKAGFGFDVTLRAEAETLRFIPDERADGVRWDNELNWSTGDSPGTQDGDSVDLGGNWVQYDGTTTLEDLHFGPGGTLNVGHGYLQIDDYIGTDARGGTLDIDGSGQFWTNGYTDQDLLTINADGGRFANTGLFTGQTDLNISDNAQVILSSDNADYVVGDGSSIEITGDDARVGFDGETGGTGVLLLSDAADLSFVADEDGLGEIREFYSGHFDDAGAGIRSGVNLGDSNLFLDISAFDTTGGAIEKIISADEIIGDFDSIEIAGLGTAQDANVLVNYDTDEVTVTIGVNGDGSGQITTRAVGEASNAQADADLWEALTNGHGVYPEDLPEDIPETEDVEDV